jgi:peptidoglycan glycosyltransferase
VADSDPSAASETFVSSTYRSQAYPNRPLRSESPRRSTAGWLAVIVFSFLAGIGIIAALSVVSVYAALANGLPSVSQLENLRLPQEIVVLDRTGKTELARFGEFKRDVAAFDEIPPVLVDATTAIEDKTFWENAGFDPAAIVAAGIDSLRGSSRGASTITQQLVRARLLDPDLVQDPERTVERKLKEIIQSIRLTKAYPDVAGKRRIIAAYLNNNYYGNQSYGVKAAARSYFGKALKDLTPGEAAILAALPQSPSNYDLVRNAATTCDAPLNEEGECPNPKENEHLILEPDSKIAQRRDAVLDLMADGRTPLSNTSPGELEAAKDQPLELAPQAAPRWTAPHFIWAVQAELAEKVCGSDTPTCDQLTEGGLRVITTLDVRLQKLAEKWVKAAVVAPKNKNPADYARDSLGFDEYPAWMRKLEDKNVGNGALVAMDYQTGEIVAHVGSANYYATSKRKTFQPQFDVVTQGFRQPGSAFKPFNYVVGIDDGTFTAANMFMDVATDFGGGYTPSDADNLERGPVRLRDALQFSLNIPSVKATALNSAEHLFARVKDFGMTFQSDTTDAGLALGLGVAETRPIDLVGAYGTLANGGVRVEQTSILRIQDAQGEDIELPARPDPVQVVKPQSAFIITDILSGNTNPRINPFWGQFRIAGPERARRPATPRTSTPTATSRPRATRAARMARMRWWPVSGTATATTRRCRRRSSPSSRSMCRPSCGRASCRRRRRNGRSRASPDPRAGSRASPWTRSPASSRPAAPKVLMSGSCPAASRRRPCRRTPAAWTPSRRRRDTKRGSPIGSTPTATGCVARKGDPARPAARTAPARRTSTTRSSDRTAGRGGRSSARRPAVRRVRRRPASRSRAPTRAA